MAHEVESMFSVRQVPWHGLGRIIQDAPDSIAAIKLAGLDWEVNQLPVSVNGKEVENYKANVRSDNSSILGIVTDRYSIVQNQEAFAFTDSLLADGEVRYETAGSLRDGRQVWMLARMTKQFSILGDKIDPYLCLVNSHDGTGAVRVLMTPVRVVCKNTLNMALGSAQRSWSTSHVGDVPERLSEAVMTQRGYPEAKRTIWMADQYMSSLDEEANLLADLQVSAAMYSEIMNEILPIAATAGVIAKNNVLRKRELITQALRADDITRFRGTGWAVMNAISDYASHSEAVRQSPTYKENQFARVISGDSLFDKAYKFLKDAA